MSKNKSKTDFQFKIVIIGDTNVGKSSILKRFVDGDNSSSSSAASTISIDFKHLIVEIGNKYTIKLQIWDTAGMEQFNTITTAYYRGAEGIYLVYDVSDDKTLKHVPHWMREVNQFANEDAICGLVGNKCDLPDSDREVTYDMGKNIAESIGSNFIETSAVNGTNIEESFKEMTIKLLEKQTGQSIDNLLGKNRKFTWTTKKNGNGRGDSVVLGGGNNNNKSNCC